MSSEIELNDCGCCADEASEPTLYNRPGLDELDYRIAVYGSFFKRMVARLGREEIPDGDYAGERPLFDLTTRAADDFSISLLDSWAVVGDVLTFYQERIANEGFLRTATERRSILELARAIGYELNPGVAADTYLAFTVDDSDTTPDEIEIPAGTQVQSLPQKQDELPQTFETEEEFTARPDWNLFVPRQTVSQVLSLSTTQIVFEGINTNLRVGDRLLIIGSEKEADHDSDVWDVRRVLTVDTDPTENQTTVTVAASTRSSFPAAPEVYAFREEASIFGHNAPSWPALSNQIKADYLGLDDPSQLDDDDKVEWPSFSIFAPGSVVMDDVIITETVQPTARMVVDAAVEAAEKQAKFLTRSAVTSVPTAAFSAISVLETLTRDLVQFSVDMGGGGTQQLIDLAAGDSPIAAITESIQNIISNIEFSPPDSGVSIDRDDVFSDPDSGVDLGDFFGNVDNLRPDKLIEKMNDALQDVLRLPFSIGFASNTQVNNEINNIKGALNDLWQLNPTLRIFNAFNQVLTATGQELQKATRNADRAFNEAVGAGSSSAISSIVEVVLENALQFDPEPDDIVELTRFTTKVARYAAALPTAAMLDANDSVNFVLDMELDQGPDQIVGNLIGSQTPIIENLDVPPAMKNLANEENRMAFYTAVGTLGVGAAGAGLALGAAGVGGGLVIGSSGLAAAIVPTLIPLMGVGIAPLLATAPGFASGIEDIYEVANRAAVRAAAPVTNTLGAKRGFFELLVDTIDLDNRYSEIVPESWVYFTTASDQELYFVEKVVETSRSEYMISAKVTRLTLDGPDLADFSDAVRELTVYAAPEKLTLAEIPKTGDVTGTSIVVDSVLPTMSVGQTLIVSGVPTGEDDTVAEAVSVKTFQSTGSVTTITLENGLTRNYQRDTVEIYGNVSAASHGETVADEVLGHGSGATPHQKFKLKKPPLTYTSASTVSGSESTLTVQVDNVKWTEVDSLYEQDPAGKVFTVRIDNEANAYVLFGDGKMGARLPTGLENVKATYRSGIGLDGEVSDGTLTLLKTKPYGVKSVTNPVEADGADDPEELDDARENAPMTVRTLDRVVSRWDYEDFAATYTGIGKAQAVPIWDGTRELVHITVADPTGNSVSSDKIDLLLSSIEKVRDPLREVIVESFTPKSFSLSARVLYDDAYDWDDVKSELEDTLEETYSFAERQFGQAVSAAELLAVMHEVDGVVAVDLDELYIDGIGKDHTLNSVLGAGIATYDKDSTAIKLADRIEPAGLLTINENGIELKEKAV